MDQEVSRLLLYGRLPEDCILQRLADVFADWKQGKAEKAELVRRIYGQVKRILDLSTTCGFDKNLWHCYLTYLLTTCENSFSLTCEMNGPHEGSVNHFALADFEIFRRLFAFDFGPIERDLGIDVFSVLEDYHAIPKKARLYNHNISEKVRALSEKIARAKDAQEIFTLVTEHYRTCGVGIFGLNHAFRIKPSGDGVEFIAINNVDQVMLSDLVGCELQQKELRGNVEAFLRGSAYNNMLLYGDAGTGKSTSVKALLNEYAAQGLRMIEIYKHQFNLLGDVIAQVKNRGYRFMIFIDDLSFEENEVEYKFLKAVIEGGIETRPDNVMICATSNRRHLIKETWTDRNDMEFKNDVHRSDTMEEKLSLAARFGCAINFNAPDRRQYHDIVKALAARAGDFGLTEEQLLLQANTWELRHGGLSGRTAQQFINHLSGTASGRRE